MNTLTSEQYITLYAVLVTVLLPVTLLLAAHYRKRAAILPIRLRELVDHAAGDPEAQHRRVYEGGVETPAADYAINSILSTVEQDNPQPDLFDGDPEDALERAVEELAYLDEAHTSLQQRYDEVYQHNIKMVKMCASVPSMRAQLNGLFSVLDTMGYEVLIEEPAEGEGGHITLVPHDEAEGGLSLSLTKH